MAKKMIHSNPHCDTKKYLFTSESVTMGHPDKVADHISDAILDAMLAQDPKSRVACETMVTTGLVVVAGEITTKGYVDIPEVIRNTVKKIGYDDSTMGFDGNDCAVVVSGRNRRHRPPQAAGRRRPGTDVRVCLQRNTHPYADAYPARTRTDNPPRKSKEKQNPHLAATRWKKSGYRRIRKRKTKKNPHSRSIDPARAFGLV